MTQIRRSNFSDLPAEPLRNSSPKCTCAISSSSMIPLRQKVTLNVPLTHSCQLPINLVLFLFTFRHLFHRKVCCSNPGKGNPTLSKKGLSLKNILQGALVWFHKTGGNEIKGGLLPRVTNPSQRAALRLGMILPRAELVHTLRGCSAMAWEKPNPLCDVTGVRFQCASKRRRAPGALPCCATANGRAICRAPEFKIKRQGVVWWHVMWFFFLFICLFFYFYKIASQSLSVGSVPWKGSWWNRASRQSWHDKADHKNTFGTPRRDKETQQSATVTHYQGECAKLTRCIKNNWSNLVRRYRICIEHFDLGQKAPPWILFTSPSCSAWKPTRKTNNFWFELE